ncbi:NAD(P)-dependent dehydrogenase (short-subunit alcohol dehydrogenase family) [Novosphingobium sp. PhB165]|uniref:SDR family NAD(P)-dependent oxidoreductase n=1 Tax=Novosphingobium sp. PhB165 TaxID=2485105 RepID=UPI0010E1F7E1|nr:SDR family NAD(P)-dependent oxidoreductase [Novosphingobium sp. PhB165]TCM20710.1 NAD(P)-dependent dehydrogenase (short-subunit alcohol dehydrogenase family) [Novosphingobium sp. PhB165]
MAMAAKRTALITGAGDPAGMGAAIARRFARSGMSVAVLDIVEEGAKEVAASITAAGGSAIAVTADVTDRKQVTEAAERVRSALGPIGVLVNNAAIEGWCKFEDLTDELWDRTMEVNLKGAFIVTQTVLPDMEAAGWGRIVNISALGGQMGGVFDMSHYNSSKGGMISFTHSLAIGLGAKGITANTVSPGFIDTPMARRAIETSAFPVDHREILKSYPIPRLGSAEDIAAAVAFFASEDAGYITNQVLGVNGGCYN